MSFKDFGDQWKKWATEEEKNKKIAMQETLKIMKQYSVKCIVALYSGSGDSGSVEEIFVLKEPIEPEDFNELNCAEEQIDKAATIRLQRTSINHALFSRWYSKPEDILEAIKCFASYLTPPGYEINDGGQGIIVFDAVNGECRCEHGSNFSEVNYDSETITLKEAEDV